MSDIKFNVNIKPDAMQLGMAFMKQDIRGFLIKEVNRLAATVERYSKQLTPVRTGRLRGSINFTPASLFPQVEVGTHTSYAIYVHEGTKYMRARPFMKYGAAFAQVGIEHQLASRLDEEFTRGFKYGGFK